MSFERQVTVGRESTVLLISGQSGGTFRALPTCCLSDVAFTYEVSMSADRACETMRVSIPMFGTLVIHPIHHFPFDMDMISARTTGGIR